ELSPGERLLGHTADLFIPGTDECLPCKSAPPQTVFSVMIDIAISRTLAGPGGVMPLRFETHIKQEEFVCIYGPSGAGKTSVLRMLAGLLTPEKGHIRVNDIPWYDSAGKVNLKPQLRSIGMVFQEYSLFPNMTVRGNLEFALQKGESKELVDELLNMTELEQLQHQRPVILSGGQKQRV